MEYSKRTRLLFALASALLGVGVFWVVRSEREIIFIYDWQKPKGHFVATPDPALAIAARDRAEKENPGQVCVEKWLGRDDDYLYMAIGCGRFQEKFGAVVVEGDRNFTATRLSYRGQAIGGYEKASLDDYMNSIHRLFPKEAGLLLLKARSEIEFGRRGFERTKALSQTAAEPATVAN